MSVAEHARLSLAWSQTPKTDFLATGLFNLANCLSIVLSGINVFHLPPKASVHPYKKRDIACIHVNATFCMPGGKPNYRL